MMADGGIVYDIEWKDEQGDTYEASFNDLDEAKEEVRKIRDEGGRIIQTWKYRDGNYVGSFAKGGKVSKDFKVGDNVIYTDATNGKFYGRNNVSNIKEGVISNIQEISNTKLYTINRFNKFGVLIDTYNTSDLKRIEMNTDLMAKGGEVKSKTKKYQILSPDGITIEREVPYYTSKNKAMNAFDKWKENYSRQGYYSSVRYGRIDLYDLADYCQFITL